MAKKNEKWPALVEAIVEGIRNIKGTRINIIDFRTLENAVSDFFIVCEGQSSTQVQALAHSIEEEARKRTGNKPHHSEGIGNAQWILLDYVDVVVHVFEPEARTFYDVEGLWSDAPTTFFEH